VAKLRHARDRIRNERGKCEGRKTRIERAERENNPELVKSLTQAADGKTSTPGVAQDRRAQIAAQDQR
jgi:hypothetical protein